MIDYGAGNLRSVLHALRHLKAKDVRLVQRGDDLHGANKIILPGVGAFGAGMQELAKRELIEPICQAVRNGTPYLGICLGMQFLFDTSDEMGEHQGLGLLPGRVTRFPPLPDLKIPHIGWNKLASRRNSVLLAGLPEVSYAYFVHSYYCSPAEPEDTLITVDYGIRFAAAVERENIYGVQFHPEKSQQVGLQILRNFLAL
ncbi:MAG: imidazole glycerol phosphate synthase subunit HisH [Anaerolineae bacterium]|nr:imidazole glycerol phosphate synthase subunit HisH [Anaerolineae bacterium]